MNSSRKIDDKNCVPGWWNGLHTGLKRTCVLFKSFFSRRWLQVILCSTVAVIGLLYLWLVTFSVTAFLIWTWFILMSAVIAYTLLHHIHLNRQHSWMLLLTFLAAMLTIFFVVTKHYPKAAYWGHGNVSQVGGE